MKRSRIYLLISITLLLIGGWLFGPRACYWVERSLKNDFHGLTEDQLDIDRKFNFSPDFPPDPGELGKKSIDGIDSDQDNVRDDVQRWIHAMHPNDSDKRFALRQFARFYQHSLQSGFEGEGVRKESVRLLDRVLDCKKLVYSDLFERQTDLLYLKAKVLNTFERTVRFLENQKFFTHKDFPARVGVEVSEQSCDRL